jgi:hypothetical protein
MSEDELVRELADRANELGIKIDMSIGEQASACGAFGRDWHKGTFREASCDVRSWGIPSWTYY